VPSVGSPRASQSAFPGTVVVDLLEAERLEPARGPWAEVSEGVPAVDDDRVRAVEAGRGLVVQLLQRDAERAREMLLLVLVRRQDLHELRTRGEELASPTISVRVAIRSLQVAVVDSWKTLMADAFPRP